MLSEKMAFSLVCRITLLTLAMAVPATVATGDFEVKVAGPTTVTYATGEATVGVKLKVIADKPLPTPLVTNLSVFDKDGFLIAIDINTPQITVTDETDYVMRTGSVRQLRVNISVTIHGDRVAKVVITVPKTATTDPTVPEADSMSKVVHHTITLTEAPTANPDLPEVVSIQRLGLVSQTVTSAFEAAEVTGAFNVRIVLTERPHGGLTLDTIQVHGGTASNLVAGVPFTWHGGRDDNNNPVPSQALRPHPSEGGYYFDRDYGPLAGVELTSTDVNDTVPLPTGADGMYHQYRVTITPHRRVDTVTISIKEFQSRDSSFKSDSREQPQLAVATTRTPIGTEVMAPLPQSEGGAQTEATATPVSTEETTADVDVSTTESVKVEVPDTSVTIPTEGQIYISEIMVAGGGTLPQWIEIANGSRTEEVNLSGWRLTVQNATADTDVSVGSKVTFTIPEGTRIDPRGQNDTPSTVLVVTEQGRTNLGGSMADGQVVNLWVDQRIELLLLDVSSRRYSLLSEIAFKITLAPPPTATEQADARVAATDVVGNLADDGTLAWALPTSEERARSSLIRRHVSAEPKDGEKMDSWVLASDTDWMDLSVRSYYGLPIDVGTPGFRAGGAVPVELSHFRPARDKATGQVVITWSTQSELNNAGFFIKRSQQKDGEFKVINAAMVAGAGTTSEKQFYTYTDTTAQPNVVYSYQIADVSLDGQRQMLTRGIRLKGHVSVAGKATATWGELKTRE